MRTGALWRVRPYVRPYLRHMVTMMVVALAGVVAGTYIPLVTKRIIDGPITSGDRHAIVPLALLALGLGVVDCGLAFVRRYLLSDVATGMETDIRNDLYAHLQRLSVSFHDEWQSGQLLSRAMTDISQIRRFVGFGVVFLVVCLAQFAMVVVLLLNLYWPLALVTVVLLAPIFRSSARFQRDYAVLSRQVQDQQGDLTTVVEEAATGIRTIKAFGRAGFVTERFRAEAATLRGTSLRGVRTRARFFTALDVIPNITLALVLLLGVMAVGRGALSLGGLVAFITLVLGLVWPMDALGWILANGQEAATAAGRIFEVFDEAPEIADRPGAVDLERVDGRVRFDDVGFRYRPDSPFVVRHVNLEIAPGETLALVGRTGSGKTTLTALIGRLYDVTEGRITIDGHDIRDLTLASLRRHVAMAFEDPLLFSASARENLLFGKGDATDDELAVAVDTAQARFVHELPWGLDTRVGEQGLSLSGGQRQRVALARAILGRPPILILDDPLSALDVHTEALVEEALARVLEGTTGLVVVHRPSTLALADRVAFLEDGTILAVGTHHELLETVPEYRAVLAQEADENEDEEEVA